MTTADYTHKVRGRDLRHAERLLDKYRITSPGELREALRTLVGFAEPIEDRPWQVLTGGTSRYPLAIIGAYATKFEANAVAQAWNRINGEYGIRYRVEGDA